MAMAGELEHVDLGPPEVVEEVEEAEGFKWDLQLPACTTDSHSNRSLMDTSPVHCC